MSLQLKGNLNQIKGQEDEILGLLQEKTGEKIENLRQMIFEEDSQNS